MLEESSFNFKYVRLCDLDITREKWLNNWQTVETDEATFWGIWSGTVLFASYPFGGLQTEMG